MIGPAERRARARSLGVQETAIERDYILSSALSAFAQDPGQLVFRGGTALARAYWPDYRLSEDLDFIAAAGVDDLNAWMVRLTASASEIAATQLTLRYVGPRGGWSRSYLTWAENEVIVDINLNEGIALGAEHRVLNLPYGSFEGQHVEVPTVSIAEILGNKWFILEDRYEPRDLYDIWWGLRQAQVPFTELARGHVAKYRMMPIRQFLTRSATRIEAAWGVRLQHQLRALPEFRHVFGEVLEDYDAWEAGGKPASD